MMHELFSPSTENLSVISVQLKCWKTPQSHFAKVQNANFVQFTAIKNEIDKQIFTFENSGSVNCNYTDLDALNWWVVWCYPAVGARCDTLACTAKSGVTAFIYCPQLTVQIYQTVYRLSFGIKPLVFCGVFFLLHMLSFH